MDLLEKCEIGKISYKYYIRGAAKSENVENFQLLGFKNDLPVVRFEEKMDSPRKINLEVDGSTGKKYVLTNGKRLEVLEMNAKEAAAKLNLKQILIHKSRLIKTENKESRTVATNTESSTKNSNETQTDLSEILLDKTTQTDTIDAVLDDDMLNYILSNSVVNDRLCEPNLPPVNDFSNCNNSKYNFFMDLRSAFIPDSNGNLPIHKSIFKNNVALVKRHCVVLKARKETPNIRNFNNYSPLQLAICQGVDDAILRILLEYGADICAADNEGNCVFHFAVKYDRASHLKLLLEFAQSLKCDFDIFNYDGFTPLSLATFLKNFECSKILLEFGARVNVRDKKSGRTPLFHAAENHDYELVKLLLSYKADTKLRNFFGTSPHDAMFEIEDMPVGIKYLILGKTAKPAGKRKNSEGKSSESKVAKIEMDSYLQIIGDPF